MVKPQTQRTGLIVFALFLAFAVALVVLIAIERNVIWPLIVGFVIVAVAVILAAAAIVNKVAVPFMDARLKYVDARLEHERRMLELQLKHTPALPKPAQASTVIPEVEPYRNLALELIAVTRDLMGDDATRIASREKAQPYGSFNNHRMWEQAVSFLTAYGLVYQMTSGGKSEGTVIDKGRTAAELARLIAPPARL